MQAEEILDALEEYLGQYVGGTRGLAWQAPYKGDLFKLFLQAYKQGYVQSTGPAPLTGSAIRDEHIARYQPQNPSQEQIEFLRSDCHPLGRLELCARSVPGGGVKEGTDGASWP
jgi:hypothetical protein